VNGRRLPKTSSTNGQMSEGRCFRTVTGSWGEQRGDVVRKHFHRCGPSVAQTLVAPGQDCPPLVRPPSRELGPATQFVVGRFDLPATGSWGAPGGISPEQETVGAGQWVGAGPVPGESVPAQEEHAERTRTERRGIDLPHFALEPEREIAARPRGPSSPSRRRRIGRRHPSNPA